MTIRSKHLTFAYDDINSLDWFGTPLPPLWKQYFPNSAALLAWPAKTEYINSFLKNAACYAAVRMMLQLHCSFDLDHRLLQNLMDLDFSQRPYYLLYCVQRWLNMVLDLIVGAEAVLVVGLAVWLRSSTSVGLLGVSLNNILCKSSQVQAVFDQK